MKGTLKAVFALALCSLLFTGCAAKEQEEETVYDRRPMVMVDSRIYLDTGRESYVTGRCAVLDGEITSEVDGSEKPAENDQSNFGTGYGYQRMDENTIELYINEKWIVFEAEDRVDEWGLTLKAENVTAKGCTLVFEQKGGSPTGSLETGEQYVIQTMRDGQWVDVPVYAESYGWNAVAWIIPMDGEKEFEVNWEWLYGTLPFGEYRIGKGVMDFRGTADYDEKEYYAEFKIIDQEAE